MSDGLHIVVFCAVDYQFLLDECVTTLKQNTRDTISSITVVSNAPLDTDINVVLDRVFWNKIDPLMQYSNMYKNNWVRQQILKLHLDKLFEGNILVCDVEVRIKQPIQWCQGKRCNIFYKSSPYSDSANFVYDILKIKSDVGYLTEATVFSSDLLLELRKQIENKFNTDCLQAYRQLIYDDPESESPSLKVFMSEYELYNNFVVHFHEDRILKLVKHKKEIYNSVQHEVQTMHQGTDTQWISFYEQIKDPDWPDCWSESDFNKLPVHIQNECIDVYGYQPKC